MPEHKASSVIELTSQDCSILRKQIPASGLKKEYRVRLLDLIDLVKGGELPVERWDPNNGTVKNEISDLRERLLRRVWLISKNRECRLSIPEKLRHHKTYTLQAARLSPEQTMWGVHARHKDPLQVYLFERLFFRYKADIYFRSTLVNDEHEKDALLRALPLDEATRRELSPQLEASRHYLTAGEFRGATALQQMFSTKLNRRSTLHGYVEDPPDFLRNQIFLAASRVDDHNIMHRDHELIRAAEGRGIEKFEDPVTSPLSRVVHVLLTRRRELDAPQTILQGAHARALQGVCKHLCQDHTLRFVFDEIGLRERRLPQRFQIVFRTELIHNPRTHLTVSRDDIHVVRYQAYPDK